MKRKHGVIVSSFILVVLLTAFTIPRESKMVDTLTGAWGFGDADHKNVMIFSTNVFSVAAYSIKEKKFIASYGGTWRVDGNKLIRTIEWHSKDSTQVGSEWTNDINTNNNQLNIAGTNEKLERLDNGGPGALAGVWVITGNYTNDKVSKRGSPFYPRRTMKVLSGKYFHWIAYNVATKQFLNAGGGTYTTADNKYTENIEFFTKTQESIGKSLVFDYSFVDGDWRHKGQKSTGGAMDECWTKRATLEK